MRDGTHDTVYGQVVPAQKKMTKAHDQQAKKAAGQAIKETERLSEKETCEQDAAKQNDTGFAGALPF